MDIEDIRQGSPWTPFDYPSIDEIMPILLCEEYTVFTLWSPCYSSSILGADRPPMEGVVRDIISLVNYLTHDGSRVQKPLLEHLKAFRTPLFALPPPLNQSIDMEWASLGLFADMFTIAIVRSRHTDYGRDNLKTGGSLVWGTGRLPSILYPGLDALRLGKSPVPKENGTTKQLWGTLEEMKAYFINSGPYEVVLSTSPSDHLTLNSQGKLRVFWEGLEFWAKGGERPLYPGVQMFEKYKYMTLGR